MNMKQFTFLLVILSQVLIAGCQNKKSENNHIERRLARGTGAQLPAAQSGQFGYQQSVGRIFVNSQYAQEFNGFFAALISATLDPKDLGYIDPQNGVRFKGYVEIDAFGRGLVGSSRIQIEIHDSFTGQMDQGQKIQPILIDVPLVSGNAYNGVAELVFQDQHGWIRLSGRFKNGQNFTGELSFANQNGREGSGVSFVISTCGFFRCQ